MFFEKSHPSKPWVGGSNPSWITRTKPVPVRFLPHGDCFVIIRFIVPNQTSFNWILIAQTKGTVFDMPVELIPAFLFYCLVSSITPGPANLCSLAAALNFGKKQALIQWKGLFTGFTIISLCSVFATYFIGSIIGEYVTFLSYIGAVYILWLAWHIWKSGDPSEAAARKRCNFYTGLFVNLTNVKIMIYCLTALSAYVLPYRQDFFSLLTVGLLLPFTGPIANLVWLFAGAFLKKFFSQYRRPLNAVMALSLVFCSYSMVTH